MTCISQILQIHVSRYQVLVIRIYSTPPPPTPVCEYNLLLDTRQTMPCFYLLLTQLNSSPRLQSVCVAEVASSTHPKRTLNESASQ